ncbi:unnamed protein product [Ixodes pacificus]
MWVGHFVICIGPHSGLRGHCSRQLRAPCGDVLVPGRYQDNFIEHRMAKLQLWVNRICQHPVMSQSSVWMHFLTCTDEKRWKLGKRKAEKDELMGTSLLAALQVPPGNLDPIIV